MRKESEEARKESKEEVTLVSRQKIGLEADPPQFHSGQQSLIVRNEILGWQRKPTRPIRKLPKKGN